MKQSWKFSLSGITLLLLCVLLFMSFETNSNNSVSVDLAHLFQNFDGTKQMENQVQSHLNRPQQMLDSLQNKLEWFKQNGRSQDEEAVSTYRKNELLSAQVKEELNKLNADYTSSIWIQINSYVQEYALENSLDYVYGVNGTGTIMYASKSKDATIEILDYVNKKYHGE